APDRPALEDRHLLVGAGQLAREATANHPGANDQNVGSFHAEIVSSCARNGNKKCPSPQETGTTPSSAPANKASVFSSGGAFDAPWQAINQPAGAITRPMP